MPTIKIVSTLQNGSTPVSVNGRLARQIPHNVETPVSDDEFTVLSNANLEGMTLERLDDETEAGAAAEGAGAGGGGAVALESGVTADGAGPGGEPAPSSRPWWKRV